MQLTLAQWNEAQERARVDKRWAGACDALERRYARCADLAEDLRAAQADTARLESAMIAELETDDICL